MQVKYPLAAIFPLHPLTRSLGRPCHDADLATVAVYSMAASGNVAKNRPRKPAYEQILPADKRPLGSDDVSAE